jgi:hypothetical protein
MARGYFPWGGDWTIFVVIANISQNVCCMQGWAGPSFLESTVLNLIPPSFFSLLSLLDHTRLPPNPHLTPLYSYLFMLLSVYYLKKILRVSFCIFFSFFSSFLTFAFV